LALVRSAQELYEGIQEAVKRNLRTAPANVDELDAEIELTDLRDKFKTALSDICSGGRLTAEGKSVTGTGSNPSESSDGGAK
jgi:hypothetical protein